MWKDEESEKKNLFSSVMLNNLLSFNNTTFERLKIDQMNETHVPHWLTIVENLSISCIYTREKKTKPFLFYFSFWKVQVI